MLSEITGDGTLVWYCQAREFADEPPCNILNMASLDEVIYREAEGNVLGKGAVIMLPKCKCKAQAFLKADYTLKELYRAVFKHEEEGMYAYVLPLRYIHNLLVHWMLYQRGKAAYAPVLDMPPVAVLEHPSFASIKPGTVYALWFGFSIVRQVAPQQLETHPFSEISIQRMR